MTSAVAAPPLAGRKEWIGLGVIAAAVVLVLLRHVPTASGSGGEPEQVRESEGSEAAATTPEQA
jgi:hypothetical protein